jgi:hypothetical protein
VPGSPTSVRRARRPRLDASTAGRSAVVSALLLAAACAFLILKPWKGPTILALSEQHGVDAADLPALVLIVLAVAGWHARARHGRADHAAGRAPSYAAAVTAAVLGALLVAGIFMPRIGAPLVPAGGGTFNGSTMQVGGLRAEAVGRWTHLAVSYDGGAVRLYINGVQVSHRRASGPIRRTTDPLWIGGNRPYGEYFDGVIDDVLVYDRALSAAEVRSVMSTPVKRAGGSPARGRIAAFSFNAGRGRTVLDDSGHRNAGTISGASWTPSGRHGHGIRFDGAGEVVRVPPSASLDLKSAMTLAAWINPSESQSGWRTVVARQRDAYTLMAGGGRQDAALLDSVDRMRFVLLIVLIAGIAGAFARGQVLLARGRRRWYWPVALFVVGSLVDAAFTHENTLVGPALVALWCGATSADRAERVGMYAFSVAFALITILSIAGPTALPLPGDDGGAMRSVALGLLLITVGALGLRKRAGFRDVDLA